MYELVRLRGPPVHPAGSGNQQWPDVRNAQRQPRRNHRRKVIRAMAAEMCVVERQLRLRHAGHGRRIMRRVSGVTSTGFAPAARASSRSGAGWQETRYQDPWIARAFPADRCGRTAAAAREIDAGRGSGHIFEARMGFCALGSRAVADGVAQPLTSHAVSNTHAFQFLMVTPLR
jgi:hypothetical protein